MRTFFMLFIQFYIYAVKHLSCQMFLIKYPKKFKARLIFFFPSIKSNEVAVLKFNLDRFGILFYYCKTHQLTFLHSNILRIPQVVLEEGKYFNYEIFFIYRGKFERRESNLLQAGWRNYLNKLTKSDLVHR